ncbi:DCC1-like thiol-disulfide oxidoreductase family protein [Ekhidna sp. To15]|uniref:DCC1-like thiol-disulfide oxidoreductase family protein n=1 Tax=Ekhidna sp. To15 TaxID=3395267 RepID=UPI003F523D96
MKLIKNYFSWIDGLLSKQVDATGLALFRIAYCLILLMEISQIVYFRHLIYDKIPFLVPAEINVLPGLIVWMVSVLFILFGFYTRQAALVNYVLSLVFIGTISTYEYHVFYTYMGVNFLFLFVDISKNHSIDRLRRKLKFSSAKFTANPDSTVGAWHYFVLIAVGVGFVYFDSIFFKLASYNWMHGLGMWLPASLPMATHFDATPILNIKWLTIGLGYLTIVFELIFLFTFFIKRFRIPLLIVGTGLHLGIIIIFPIPWFGMCVLAIYLLMIPHSFWKWMERKIHASKSSLTVYYDEHCPLCNRTRITVNHFDYLNKIEWKEIGSSDSNQIEGIEKSEMYQTMHGVNAGGKVVKGVDTYLKVMQRIPLLWIGYLVISIPGIYHLAKWVYSIIASQRSTTHCTDENCGYIPPSVPSKETDIKILETVTLRQLKVFGWGSLLILLVLFQINVTTHSKLFNDLLKQTGVYETPVQKTFSTYSKKVWGVSKILFGITRHGVFMDGHFYDYNHIIGVEAVMPDGSRQWLPIINKDGTAGWYDYSFNWVKWTFRVVDNEVNSEALTQGIRDFSTFWAGINGYNVYELSFNIYARPLEIPRKWEKNFLRNQKGKNWKMVGNGYWEGDKFISTFPPIETIKFDE